MLLMYFLYHSDCYRTVSKSVVFIPVHDTWKANKNEMEWKYSFIHWSVLWQFHSLFQSEFSTKCDLVLPPIQSMNLKYLNSIFMILSLYTLVGLPQLHHYVRIFTNLSEVTEKASEFYNISSFSQTSPIPLCHHLRYHTLNASCYWEI